MLIAVQPFHKHFVCIGGGPLILALVVVVVHPPLFSSKQFHTCFGGGGPLTFGFSGWCAHLFSLLDKISRLHCW